MFAATEHDTNLQTTTYKMKIQKKGNENTLWQKRNHLLASFP